MRRRQAIARYEKEHAERTHASHISAMAELDVDHDCEHRCRAIVSSRKRDRDGVRHASLSAPLKQWTEVLSVSLVMQRAEAAYDKLKPMSPSTSVSPDILRNRNNKLKPIAACTAIIAKHDAQYDVLHRKLLALERQMGEYEAAADGRYLASCGFTAAGKDCAEEFGARETFQPVWRRCQEAETLRVAALKKKKKPAEPKETVGQLRATLRANVMQTSRWKQYLLHSTAAQKKVYRRNIKLAAKITAQVEKTLKAKLLFTAEYDAPAMERLSAGRRAKMRLAARCALVGVLLDGAIEHCRVRAELATCTYPNVAHDGDSSSSSDSDDDGVARGFLDYAGYTAGVEDPPSPSTTPVYPPVVAPHRRGRVWDPRQMDDRHSYYDEDSDDGGCSIA